MSIACLLFPVVLGAVAASTPIGCLLNGTMFGEGSAMVTSTNCEYCYCIKGRQHCVRPQCLLDVIGCTPQYSEHSCCPVKYNCRDLNSTTQTSTTTKSSLASQPGLYDCQFNGSKYSEGEKIETSERQCENCYCMKGKVQCKPIVCPVPLKQCFPVTSPGHCCPTSYNCSNSQENFETTTTEGDMTTTEFFSTTFPPDITTIETENSYVETSTIAQLETTNSLQTLQPNDTEQRSVTSESSALSEHPSTMQPFLPETTTVIPETANISTDTTTASSPTRSIPDVIEAIINRTLAKDEDYEYDYNEPSLPPSLPNLKIIPFVAADAVVNEDDAKGKTEEPLYFDYPQPSRFSPPSKTEGGFVPRHPIIDGPFYESKFGKPFLQNNGEESEITAETQQLPPITEPPKLFEEAKCIYHGKTYHHGEVVSEPNACELCVCYYGQSYCQKPKCSPVKEGCERIINGGDKSCCGRIVCGGLPLKIADLESSTLSTLIPESMSNIPAVTVADLVVTPDPFKDVIKTEPAPDLSDIMKDMLPHLKNESSANKPPLSHPDSNNSKLTTPSSTKFTPSTDSKLNLNTTVANNTQQTEISAVSNLTDVKVNLKDNTSDRNLTGINVDVDDDDDSFSFESVLGMLFHRTDTPTTRAPVTTTSAYNNLYSLKDSSQKQDINNVIETTDTDFIGQKEKITEKSPEPIEFEDYQTGGKINKTKVKNDSFKSKEDKKTTESIKSPLNVLTSTNKTTIDDPRKGIQLKLAGCNIYGRMYEVGKIISELSGPCLECMCTDFGVQCRKICRSS